MSKKRLTMLIIAVMLLSVVSLKVLLVGLLIAMTFVLVSETITNSIENMLLGAILMLFSIVVGILFIESATINGKELEFLLYTCITAFSIASILFLIGWKDSRIDISF